MSSLFLLFFNLVFAQTAVGVKASAVPSCRAQTPLAAPITPQSLRNWLGGNGNLLRDPGDFICCLPPEYRDTKFLTIHSSIAGQNGTPESPRLILRPYAKDPFGESGIEENFMAFTINGGADGLTQKDAIEIMHYQNKTGDLAYYDLQKDAGQVFMISEPNPTDCMRCHGEAGGRVPRFGPRPLFDEDPWFRIVGGTDAPCNPEEDRLQYEKTKKALQAVRDNPRFACLDKSEVLKALAELEKNPEKMNKALKKTSHDIASFDNLLGTANIRRIARMVLASPDYAAYKFVMAGSEICEVGSELEAWLPPSILARHSDLSSVTPENKNIHTLADLQHRRSQLKTYTSATRRQQGKEFKDKNKLFNQPMKAPESIYSCFDGRRNDHAAHERLQTAALKLKNPTLRAYTLDSILLSRPNTPPSGNRIDGLTRYLFEARGLPISNWSRDLGRGHYQQVGQWAAIVRYANKGDAELNDMVKPIDYFASENSKLNGAAFDKKREQVKTFVCENLRKKSYEALAKLKVPAPAAETAKESKSTRATQ